jgi:hypothetical protein
MVCARNLNTERLMGTHKVLIGPTKSRAEGGALILYVGPREAALTAQNLALPNTLRPQGSSCANTLAPVLDPHLGSCSCLLQSPLTALLDFYHDIDQLHNFGCQSQKHTNRKRQPRQNQLIHTDNPPLLQPSKPQSSVHHKHTTQTQ